MLSEVIRDAMRKDGRSLYQISVDSGVSRPQVIRFYNGTRTLTLPAADRLCAALGLELRSTGQRKGKGV